MKKLFLSILTNLFLVQLGFTINYDDSIEIQVINIKTGMRIEFDYELTISNGKDRIKTPIKISRKKILESNLNDVVEINLRILNYRFKSELSKHMISTADKLVFKLNFDDGKKCTKIFYMNPIGEVLLQEIANNIDCSENYEILEIHNKDWKTHSLDGSELYWFENNDMNYRTIYGDYKAEMSKDKFLEIQLRDSMNLTMKIVEKGTLKKTIEGLWIFNEDFSTLFINTEDSLEFYIEEIGKVNLGLAEFEIVVQNEMKLNYLINENNRITKLELLSFKKK